MVCLQLWTCNVHNKSPCQSPRRRLTLVSGPCLCRLLSAAGSMKRQADVLAGNPPCDGAEAVVSPSKIPRSSSAASVTHLGGGPWSGGWRPYRASRQAACNIGTSDRRRACKAAQALWRRSRHWAPGAHNARPVLQHLPHTGNAGVAGWPARTEDAVQRLRRSLHEDRQAAALRLGQW